MKRSEVERVADRMLRESTLKDPSSVAHAKGLPRCCLRAIARWHLREVRRARGRTVGYGVLPPPLSHWTRKPYFKMGVWTRKAYSGNNARVVLAPKPKRRKR